TASLRSILMALRYSLGARVGQDGRPAPFCFEENMFTQQIDVQEYLQQGYLTAAAIFSPHQLDELRRESDRLVALCYSHLPRYEPRIQWERDYLAPEQSKGMERVIRKLEPISDISPIFADFAFHEGVVDPVSAIFGQPVELFEDKLNLKLPNGSP